MMPSPYLEWAIFAAGVVLALVGWALVRLIGGSK